MDTYPLAVKEGLTKNMYQETYSRVLEINFRDAGDITERLFENLKVTDQYAEKHYLPLYLSKITNPD